MKKYLVLFFVLAITVLPAFGDVVMKGQFRYGGVWNTGDEEYMGEINRFRFPMESKIDEYNKFKARVEENDMVGDLGISYGYLITDWGKFFELDTLGLGIKTTIGQQNSYYKVFEPSKVGAYTMYHLDAYMLNEEGQDDPSAPADGGNVKYIDDTPAIRIDLDIKGVFQPYYVTSFHAYDDSTNPDADNQGDDIKEYFIGTDFDYDAISATVYYGQEGLDEGGKIFGMEAQYRDNITDDIELTVGSIYTMVNDAADDWYWYYTFGAGVKAYGAEFETYARGMKEDVFQKLYSSASYNILSYLGVEGGMQLAFGDNNNNEAFVGAEFGIFVKPGKSTFTLGYLTTNEDAVPYRTKYNALENNPATKGIYFTVESDF